MNGRRSCQVLAALGLCAAAACAHKIPEPAGAGAEPHITWAIGAGTSSGDELHVCQSSSRSNCEMSRSTSGAPVRSSIHLHMHAGSSGAFFEGEMRATFLTGAPSAGTKVNNTVLATREANANLSGVVVDKPGTYEFTFSIVARGVGGDRKIEDRVEVAIR
jgi:hypothetical protein